MKYLDDAASKALNTLIGTAEGCQRCYMVADKLKQALAAEPPQADASAEILARAIAGEIGGTWEAFKTRAIAAIISADRRAVLEKAAERLNKAADDHVQNNGVFASGDYELGLRDAARIILGTK